VSDTPFCVRCKEDFPVADEPATWRMGQLRPLRKAPKRIRERFREWLSEDAINPHPMLCGNCYFDLTDDEW
jgi:hypothetical protein